MSQQSRPYIPLQTMGDGPQYGDPYNNMSANTSSTILGKDETPKYAGTMPLSKTWGGKWRHAVERGFWPRVIYALFGSILLGLWLGLLLNFTDHESQYQNEDYIAMQDRLSSDGITTSDRTVDPELWYLKGSLVQFDQKTRLLSVKWSLLWSRDGSYPQPFGVKGHRIAIGLFRDQSLKEDTAARLAAIRNVTEQAAQAAGTIQNVTEYTETIMKFAGLRIDDRGVEPIATLGQRSWDDAQTDIGLQHAVTGNAWLTPSIGFPFDQWAGTIGFVISYQELSTAFKSPGSFATFLDDAYLEGSLLNWRVSIDRFNTCTNSTRTAVDVTPSYPCQLKLDFHVRRPGLVIFASIVAVAVNWLSTIFIFIMTCEGVILRRTRVIEGPGLLAVCFTALFALPTVRSILPGAPDFGALIDLVGVVPNVIIISVCTVMVSVSILRPTSRSKDKELPEEQQQLLRRQ